MSIVFSFSWDVCDTSCKKLYEDCANGEFCRLYFLLFSTSDNILHCMTLAYIFVSAYHYIESVLCFTAMETYVFPLKTCKINC